MHIMEWDEVNFNPYGNVTSGSHIGFFTKLGVPTIFMEKPEIPVRKVSGSRHLFGKLLKIWAVIWGNSIFLLFFVCSFEFIILCKGSFSHQVKFYSFVFILCAQDFYPRMACANSKSTLDFLRKFLSLLLVHFLIFMCMFVGLCYKFIQ